MASICADRFAQAQSERQLLWSPGTWLNILAGHTQAAFCRRPSRVRSSWNTIIYADSATAALPAWLACKFDLDEESRLAVMDTVNVDLQVVMLQEDDSLVSQVRTSWRRFYSQSALMTCPNSISNRLG